MTTTSPIDLLGARPAAYIDGAWGGAGAKPLAVVDPATEETLIELAGANVDDARRAVEAAARAQVQWAAKAPRERAETLRRVYEILKRDRERFGRLIVLENGKALKEAIAEVDYSAEFFRWYSEEAVRIGGTIGTAPGGSARMIVTRQPVGLALLITPWNLPLAMGARKVAPALGAGCAVLLKPASLTPLSSLALAAVCEEAGVPAGVVNVLPTTETGRVVEAIMADDRVRKLSFTGSTEVGRGLLAAASKSVMNCSMELGGNAPFIVFGDADIDAAVAGAMIAKMRHNGEACTAANRFYVHAAVAAEFSHKLAERMRALKVGNGLDDGVEVGPMVDAATRDKVAELVGAAVGHGARVHTGGEAPAGRGYFYTPTVLGSVAPDSPILDEEIFGPVAPVVEFEDVDWMVGAANNTIHGLTAYVYTRDLALALRTAERLESGMVGINRGIVSDPAAPFGGVKQSGIGREGGHEGILDYTETKYIAADW